jgi:hypothetical protein
VRPDTDNSQHWLMRAAEARVKANSIKDETSKQTILAIAATYDKLAKFSEKRAATATKNPAG